MNFLNKNVLIRIKLRAMCCERMMYCATAYHYTAQHRKFQQFELPNNKQTGK